MNAHGRLMALARRAASSRGHILGAPVLTVAAGRTVAVAECRRCGAFVQTDTKPAPNDIDVGGDAVAVDCPFPRPVRRWYIGALPIAELEVAASSQGRPVALRGDRWPYRAFVYASARGEFPTAATHPEYLLVVGPFKTRRGAQYAAANPGAWSTVDQAESRAKVAP